MITDNILRGEKIRLTSVTKEDIKAISQWYEDAGFSRLFDATPAVPSPDVEVQQWICAAVVVPVRPLNVTSTISVCSTLS